MSAAAARKVVKPAAEFSTEELVDSYLERAGYYLTSAVRRSETVRVRSRLYMPSRSTDEWALGAAFGFYHSAHRAAMYPAWPSFADWADAYMAACDGGDGTATDWTQGGHA